MKFKIKRWMAVLLTVLMMMNSFQMPVLAADINPAGDVDVEETEISSDVESYEVDEASSDTESYGESETSADAEVYEKSEDLGNSETYETAEDTINEELTYVNPIYKDVVDASELLSVNENEVSTLSDIEYCTSVSEAGFMMSKLMEERNEDITIFYETTDENYSQYMQMIADEAMSHTGAPTRGDYLKFQYAGWKCSLKGSVSDGTYYLQLNYAVTYYTTADQEELVDEKVNQLLSQLDLREKSNYEKITGVYDYICSHVTYDYDHLDDESYKLQYTAYAALINGTAVCQGYSVLLYRLLEELGVDGRIISGTGNGGPHAWNIAKIAENYYNLDSTWDAGRTTYNYFLKCNENFADHTRDAEYSSESFNNGYPMGTEDYTYTGIIDSGSCGKNLNWKVTENGVLTISGSGTMYSYAWGTPWYKYSDLIETAVIEEGVTSIGNSAFFNLDNLKNVEISETVESIATYAFSSCDSLESICIPAGVTQIEGGAFSGSQILKKIDVEEGSASFCSVDGVLYSVDMTTLIAWPSGKQEQMNIADSVKHIVEKAFAGCEMTELDLPEGLESIGEQCFFLCENLETLHIPATVTSIGALPFYQCNSLKQIDVEDGNPYYSSTNGGLFYKGEDGVKELVEWPVANSDSVVLPEDVNRILQFSLRDCKLTEVVIPKSVNFIADYAFYGCKNLTSVKFTGNVPEIEGSAFSNVTATCYYPAGDSSWTEDVRQDYDGTLTWVEAGSESEEKELTIIQQPESVTGKLGETAVFKVEAEGDGVTYQWQYCNNGSSSWKNSSMMGSTTNSIEVKITKGRIGQKYRCILQDSRDKKLVSEEAQIKLAEEKELAITKQPESVTGKIGETASFTVEAEGDGVTYQWQYCNSGSSAWKNSSMTGSTTNSIEVKITKGRIGQKYRCILKDSKGNKLTTEEAQIIQAEEKKLAVIQQPESVTGKIGETAIFAVEAEGEGVTYQWQYCNSGSSAWKNSSMTGSTTNSIEVKITKGRIGQKYRCILKDSKGNKLTTEEAQIKLAEEKELAIVKQPESVTGKVGETAIFTVEAEGEGVTYQWQYCNNGSTSWANSKMTGCDTNSIEVKITKGRIGQKYRCILKDSKGNKLTTEEAQIIQAEK